MPSDVVPPMPQMPPPIQEAPEISLPTASEIPKVPEHIGESVPPVPRPAPIPIPIVERQGDIVFDKTIQPQEEPIAEPEISTIPEPGKPLFVSVQDYQEILNGIQTTKQALEEAEEVITKLNDLKNAQEHIFEDWKNQMEDVERKLSYVDEVIAQGE